MTNAELKSKMIAVAEEHRIPAQVDVQGPMMQGPPWHVEILYANLFVPGRGRSASHHNDIMSIDDKRWKDFAEAIREQSHKLGFVLHDAHSTDEGGLHLRFDLINPEYP